MCAWFLLWVKKGSLEDRVPRDQQVPTTLKFTFPIWQHLFLEEEKVTFLSKHATQISLNPMDTAAIGEKRNIQRDYLFQAMFAAISGSPVSTLPL